MEDSVKRMSGLSLVAREERMKQHCVKTTQALRLYAAQLKDVCFKCTDDAYVYAHKFILGSQCQYFRSVLYREGIMNVSTNSIKGKKYRFPSTSRCFNSLLEFLYTGQILQIENAPDGIDSCLPHVGDLLALSRQSNHKKDGMGGLDQYLIGCLCASKPLEIRAAMMRLNIGLKSRVQEVVDETKYEISQLEFTRDAFKEVGPEVVELVLRDVPLAAPEIEVWRSVKDWADEFFDDLSDPDFSPSSSPQADDRPPVVPEALKIILSFIDLECINRRQVVEEIQPLKLFDPKQLAHARRAQAVKGTGLDPSRPSERRGKWVEDAGNTVVNPC